MQVTIEKSEIDSLEQQVGWLMGLVRAMAVKHSDNGVYRLTTPEMSKAAGFDVGIQKLKKSTKFTVSKASSE